MILENCIKILKQKLFFVHFFLGVLIILTPSYFFLDAALIRGNLGLNFLRAEIILTAISAILFGFFLASVLYKLQYFSVQDSSKGILGGAFVMLVSGCPSCSITLAYYIGLAGIISTLPYHGLELKVLGIGLIGWALYDTLKHLEVCKVKQKKSFIQKILLCYKNQ